MLSAVVAPGHPLRDDHGMPRHDVQLRLKKNITIENVDATFRVVSDDELLGHLHVSKGSVDWQPAHGQMAYKLRWERFAELAVDHGRKRRIG